MDARGVGIFFSLFALFLWGKTSLLNPELACSLELAVRLGQSPSCFHSVAAQCAGPCLLLGLWHLTSATLAWAARALTHRAVPPVRLFLFLFKLYAKLVRSMPSYSFFSCSSASDWFPCLLRQPYFYLQDTFCVSI